VTGKQIFLFLIVLAVGISAWGATERDSSFDHSKAKHRTLNCARCHKVTMNQPYEKKWPGHIACGECHDFAKMATTKYVEFCGICHAGKPESAERLELFPYPKPGIRSDFGLSFSHVAHLKSKVKPPQFPADRSGQTMRCFDCHFKVQVVASTEKKQTAVPEFILDRAHPNCFRCHGEVAVKPPSMNQCGKCHSLKGPKPPHLWNIVESFDHEDHNSDIRPKKKSEIGKKIDLCSECHAGVVASTTLIEIKLPASKTCSSCHNGKFGLPEPLPKKILSSLEKR